jgi:hypothetical protein
MTPQPDLERFRVALSHLIVQCMGWPGVLFSRRYRLVADMTKMLAAALENKSFPMLNGAKRIELEQRPNSNWHWQLLLDGQEHGVFVPDDVTTEYSSLGSQKVTIKGTVYPPIPEFGLPLKPVEREETMDIKNIDE